MTRVITGLALAAAFLSVAWHAPSTAFTAMVAAIAGICFAEFAGMARHKGIRVFKWRGLLAAGAIPIAFYSASPVVFMVMSLIVAAMVMGALADADAGVEGLVFTVFGIFYVGLAYAAPVLITRQPDGAKWFLLICCATWGADIGAYYVGRMAGRTKLAPAISPNKTVEGLLGGVVSAVVAAGLFAHYIFPPAHTPLMIFGAGLIGGLIGPAGDLVESMMKRHFGVKDSGTLLPGHGGFLDRTDALMLTAPAFYVFMALCGKLL